MSKMQKQYNIKIHQDWDKVRSLYSVLMEKKSKGLLEEVDMSEQKYSDNARLYAIGTMGGLLSTDDLGIKDWTMWSGLLLEKQLPWADQAREYFSGLNLHGFTWNPSIGSAQRHIDAPMKVKTFPMCKINYIVKSDDINARTVSYDLTDETYTETYYSVPDTAWLLKISMPHEVINDPNGKRELLQFEFHNEFEEVAEYLDKKDSIVFGEQE
jgi:hypothetical protein